MNNSKASGNLIVKQLSMYGRRHIMTVLACLLVTMATSMPIKKGNDFVPDDLKAFYGFDFGIDTGGAVSVAGLRANSKLEYKITKWPIAKFLNDSSVVRSQFSIALTRIVIDLRDGRTILVDQAGYWSLRDKKGDELKQFAFGRIQAISLALIWRDALTGKFD
jgi:hypothetical protein